MAVSKWHHHNSVQFRCKCGQLWRWSREDCGVSALLEGTYYVWCPCGMTHYKDQTNFRGDAKAERESEQTEARVRTT